MTTKKMPPSAPHRSNFASSTCPPWVNSRRACARDAAIASTLGCRRGSGDLRQHLRREELEGRGRAAIVQEEDELVEAELHAFADAVDDLVRRAHVAALVETPARTGEPSLTLRARVLECGVVGGDDHD